MRVGLSLLPGWCLPTGRQGMVYTMYIVYALRSLSHNYVYVGMTDSLERRLQEHNAGRCKSTSPRAPYRVIYTESQPTREQAREREKYWKSGSGKEKLRKI